MYRLPPSQPSLPALLGPSRGRRVGSRGIKHQTNGFIHSSRTKREKTTMHCRAIVLGWLLITRHSVTRACRLHSFVACHHQSSPARALLTAFSISIIPTDRPLLLDGCVCSSFSFSCEVPIKFLAWTPNNRDRSGHNPTTISSRRRDLQFLFWCRQGLVAFCADTRKGDAIDSIQYFEPIRFVQRTCVIRS